MIKRIHYATEDIYRIDGPARLEYYLLQEEGEFCPCYGAEVVLESRGRRESAAVRRITGLRACADALMARLVRKIVTPGTLRREVEEQGNKL